MIKDVDVGAIMEVVDRTLGKPWEGKRGFCSAGHLSRFIVPFMAASEFTRDELILQGVAYGAMFDNLAVWFTDVPNGKRLSARGKRFDDECDAQEFARQMGMRNYFDLEERVRTFITWVD